MNPQELLFIIKARNEAAKNLKGLDKNLKDLGRSAAKTQKAFKATDGGIKKLRTQAIQARRPLNALRSALERVNAQRLAGANKGVNNLSRAAKLAQGATSKLLGIITRFGGAFAAGFAGITLFQKVAAEVTQVEVSLAKVEGLVGVAKDQIKGLGDAIQQISLETGRTQSELGEALFFITSAGLRGTRATEALLGAAKAATAGLGETKTIALALAAALNAYAKEGLLAAEATDILVKTVELGNFETAAFAGALGQALPILSNAGISLNEVGASVAVLTRVSGDAGTAINGLRSFVVALTKASTSGKKILEANNTSFAELRDILKKDGVLAAVRALSEAVGDNDEALTDILGRIEATTFVLSIMGQETETVNQVFADMQETVGKTDEAFKTVAETIQGRYDIAMRNLEATTSDVVKQMLNSMIPTLEFMVKNFGTLATLVSTFATVALGGLLVKGLKIALGALAAWGAGITTIIGLLRALLVSMLAIPFLGWAAAAALAITAIIEMEDSLDRAEAAMDSSGIAMNELTGIMERLAEQGSMANKELKDLAANSIALVSKEIVNLTERMREITDPGFFGVLTQLFQNTFDIGLFDAFGKALGLAVDDLTTFEKQYADLLAQRLAATEKVTKAQKELFSIREGRRTSGDVARDVAAREAAAKAAAALAKVADKASADALKAMGKALDGLRSKFFPVIDAERKLTEMTKQVNLAIGQGSDFLAKHGLTADQAKEALERFRQAQIRSLDIVGQAIKKQQEQINMITLTKSARAALTAETAILNLAEKKNLDIGADQVKLLGELAAARVKLAGAVAFQRTVEDQLIQKALTGPRQKTTFEGTVVDGRVQIEMIKRTVRETERLTAAVEAYRRARDLGFSEEEAKAQAAIIIRNMDDIRESMIAAGKDGAAGFKAAFQEIADDALTTFEFVRDLTKGVFEDMKGFIKDFVQTGEADFAGFVAAINARILDMALDSLFAEIAGSLFPTGAVSTPEDAAVEAAKIVSQAVTEAAAITTQAQVGVQQAVTNTQSIIMQLNTTLTTIIPPIDRLTQAILAIPSTITVQGGAGGGTGGGGTGGGSGSVGEAVTSIFASGTVTDEDRRAAVEGAAKAAATYEEFNREMDAVLDRQNIEAAATFINYNSAAATVGNIFTSGLDQTLSAIVSDTTGIGINFGGLFASALDSVIDAISGGGGGGFGGLLGTAAGFFGFAKGGIMTAQGSLPLKKYAHGGIASTPQVSVFGKGESDFNEAYVPLPDGRSIPVTLGGSAGAGGGAPTKIVNVRNQMNITTTDANSFGRNESQITRRFGRATRNALLRDD